VSSRERYDVLVVGGGPVGLVTAIEARARGMRVAVADHARPPIDKACGEGVMPDGVRVLERLGIALAPGESAPFRGIVWTDGERTAAGAFRGRPGHGVRRTRLHRALVERAETAGVELRWDEAVLGPDAEGVRTRRGRVAARWIVGADGLRSAVRSWAGLEGRPARRRRFGLRRHFAVEPWSDRVEVHWGAGVEAYVTPVGPREVGVAILWSGARAGSWEQVLAQWPPLLRHLRGARVASRDRGAGPLEQRVRAVTRGNVLLVGDAAGYVDAITGEGLSVAFHQAGALADALEREDPRGYAVAHRRIVALPEAVTRLLLRVERRPALRRRVLRALSAAPDLFSRLLAVHVRAARPAAGGGPALARLLWRTLLAGA
jgi:flavin-dependent dehydrogenase